jgi:hypothetical protein
MADIATPLGGVRPQNSTNRPPGEGVTTSSRLYLAHLAGRGNIALTVGLRLRQGGVVGGVETDDEAIHRVTGARQLIELVY